MPKKAELKESKFWKWAYFPFPLVGYTLIKYPKEDWKVSFKTRFFTDKKVFKTEKEAREAMENFEDGFVAKVRNPGPPLKYLNVKIRKKE